MSALMVVLASLVKPEIDCRVYGKQQTSGCNLRFAKNLRKLFHLSSFLSCYLQVLENFSREKSVDYSE